MFLPIRHALRILGFISNNFLLTKESLAKEEFVVFFQILQLILCGKNELTHAKAVKKNMV